MEKFVQKRYTLFSNENNSFTNEITIEKKKPKHEYYNNIKHFFSYLKLTF